MMTSLGMISCKSVDVIIKFSAFHASRAPIMSVKILSSV